MINYYDLNSKYYSNENYIGKNRTENYIKKLQNLNHYVKVSISES